MKDAQKPDHVSLVTLVNRLREGRYVIPDFQRDFEWRPWDISALMRSIFLDYFIGSLLFWKGKEGNFEALSCEPVYGFKGESKQESIVLDGQQRLTALYYVFMAPDIPLPNRSRKYVYFIRVDKFMDEFYDEAFEYGWTKGSYRLMENEEAQFEKHIFPLSVIGKGGFELATWVQSYSQHWKDKAEATENAAEREEFLYRAEKAIEFGHFVRELIEQYQVSYIELDKDLAIDKVCDIFTQINSRGIRLDAFDLLNALLKPKGLQLKHMWRKAAPRLDFVDSDKLNVYILQVMSILVQAYCSPKYLYYLLPGQEKTVRNTDGTLEKEVLIPNAEDFESQWNNAVDSLEQAISLLRQPQEFGVTSSAYLPYVSILPAFASAQYEVGKLAGNGQLNARRKVSHWYWASVFTNRYSGSVESTAAKDFLDLKSWFEDDSAEPLLISEFSNRFRSLDLSGETKKGSSIFNAVFNLLVINGARDWISGQLPLQHELDDHHIVPRSWAKENIEGNIFDSILNRTPLTQEANRNIIRDRLPSEYLPELVKTNGEKAVLANLETHFISRDIFEILVKPSFDQNDFLDFIEMRQTLIKNAIEELLVKERLDLSIPLRELDEAVERVELSLRESIVSKLNNNYSAFPEHVRAKVEERIRRASRKNPGLNLEEKKELTTKIQYCDLRELEDIIVNKSNWAQFEEIFGTKEQLSNRFGQLSELRNSIRHNRSLDDVTKKDGEAAISWFDSQLGLKSPS